VNGAGAPRRQTGAAAELGVPALV